MADSYTSYQYRLRAGAPMPVAGGFVLHTFMAEVNKIDILMCTESIVGSDQFRGQRRGAELISASYTRLPHRDGNMFQGKLVYNPSFVDEGDYDIF
jgi:hypothetical protein